MVLRGWGARVCALRKSRTRAREPGRDSRPGDRSSLTSIAGAAHRSIRLLCVLSDDSRDIYLRAQQNNEASSGPIRISSKTVNAKRLPTHSAGIHT